MADLQEFEVDLEREEKSYCFPQLGLVADCDKIGVDFFVPPLCYQVDDSIFFCQLKLIIILLPNKEQAREIPFFSFPLSSERETRVVQS